MAPEIERKEAGVGSVGEDELLERVAQTKE